MLCLLVFVKVVPKLAKVVYVPIKNHPSCYSSLPLPFCLSVHHTRVHVPLWTCRDLGGGYINDIIIHTLWGALLFPLNNWHLSLLVCSDLFHPINGLHNILHNRCICYSSVLNATEVAFYFLDLHAVLLWTSLHIYLWCVHEYICRKVFRRISGSEFVYF